MLQDVAVIAPKSPPFRVRSTDDGIHLDGSILWFDAQQNGELTFLSSALVAKSRPGPQVIATEETVRILEARRKKPKALVCQYNRPFSIGRLKMELLPSGSVLGGALLYLETENKRILYAPALQSQKIATVRQLQLKKAHTLIIGTVHPDPTLTLPNRRKEKERLLQAVKHYIDLGLFPQIYCEPTTTAQELTKFFNDNQISVAVHPKIFRIHKVYESSGSKLGSYSLYSEKWSKRKVALFPLPETPSARRFTTDLPTFYVEDILMEDPNLLEPEMKSRTFHISTTCDGKELKEIIAAVAPKEIYVFGPYAKRYEDELRSTFPKIKALFANSQPTLF